MSQKPKMSCTSDKFSINFYTDSLLSWHGKLVICRTCSVYVICKKKSLSKLLSWIYFSFFWSQLTQWFSLWICFAVVYFIDSVFLFFLWNWVLFLSDTIKCLSLRMLAAFSVLLDPIADTLAHHLALDFFLPLCSWKNSLSKMKIKRKNLMCYG